MFNFIYNFADKALPAFVSLLCFSLLLNNAWAKSSVWQVSKGNDYVYIGGTVHMLPASEFPLPAEFAKAYQDSDSIVLETKLPEASDTAFQLQMMQKMTYTDGSTINSYLSKSTQQSLKQYVSSLGADMAMFQQFKPGFLMTMFALLEAQRLGMSGEGVDLYYSHKAKADKKSIEYFESVQFQLNMVSSMGQGYEDEFIKTSIKQMASFEKTFKGLLSAWRSGDEQQLVKLAIEPMKEDRKSFKTMLLDRNKNWIKTVDKMFTDKDKEFVLVGAAHLVGEGSLLDLLRAKGYKVSVL